MEFLRVKEIKEQFVSRYRLLSLAFFFTFLALVLAFPRLCVKGRAYLLGIHLALF